MDPRRGGNRESDRDARLSTFLSHKCAPAQRRNSLYLGLRSPLAISMAVISVVDNFSELFPISGSLSGRSLRV
jgi:hypothetical protein